MRRWVPELRVGVAHGQMAERALEGVMMKFLRGDFDVLVSTTIIESGLDIPQANTLVVERADTLGLAQLYQIRGRVGRSDEVAHAYLFYPDRRELTEEARHRLSTLADYTELGSGYRIAMRDLELRGAGNLLGDEQSGHVAAVGFELYCELLAEAVAELQGAPRRGREARAGRGPGGRLRARRATCRSRRSRSICTGGSRWPPTAPSCASSRPSSPTASGRCPEPVANLLAIQELRLVAAEMGWPSVTLRGGTFTVGPVALGSAEVRALRERFPCRPLHRRHPRAQPAAGRPAAGDPAGCRPGAGIARCYNRNPPRDRGVVRSMGRTPRIISLAAVAALAAACGGSSSSSSSSANLGSDDVAVVGQNHITKQQLDHQITLELAAMAVKKQKIPKVGHDRATRARSSSRSLQYLVQNAEVHDIAKDLSVSVTPKQIQDQID